VALACDIHGHSKKKNVFMYGCHSPASDIYANRNNSLIRLFPYLISQKSKIFNFNDCRFVNDKEKEATARLVLFKELGIVNSYTLETTFFGSDFLKEGSSQPGGSSMISSAATALSSGLPTATVQSAKKSASIDKKLKKKLALS
jgi:hypothetical protein